MEKKLQKPRAIEDVFDVLVPFIFIAAADPVVIFVVYNFLIADQNLSGEEALSCNCILHFVLKNVHNVSFKGFVLCFSTLKR